ncbi:zinc-dependent alcohol dehydrogenase family protein [Thiohalobacter sp. IOR34]|uniref:zinc-dependent alcohol dehydrogenase family protein n=1 Tax=Thiohalobacter sp. IOR34 TaxID=3057176 RepID=UPI0025B0E2A0|nr:zinc-dependent alcohol dehydrogenase family protein [Thiohalobacter sp. IOR34]WJW76123.1 zinc-dependent alcohol dehydrogenase family protein [Thiohalobacter sp. IOR34]
MKAYVINRFGGPEVFEAAELPRPEPGPGEVLIRVVASSVNPIDCKIRRGEVPVGPDFPAVLHADVAGVIEALGEGVDAFRVGDEVYGCAGGMKGLPGALAEYMRADARLIAPAPRRLPLEEAAVLPLVAITAWEAVIDKLDLQAGRRLLVYGGSGGVGHIGVQLGRWRGAIVHATGSREDKRRAARELGAVETIDYRQEAVEDFVARLTGGEGYDAVFDTVGQPVLADAISAAAFWGQVVTVSGRATLDLKPAFQKSLSLHTVFMLIPMLHNRRREAHGAILRQVAALVDAGELRPLIHERRFGFSEVGAAHALLESGQALGKIALRADW